MELRLRHAPRKHANEVTTVLNNDDAITSPDAPSGVPASPTDQESPQAELPPHPSSTQVRMSLICDYLAQLCLHVGDNATSTSGVRNFPDVCLCLCVSDHMLC